MSPALAALCSLGCAMTWAFATVVFARVMRSNASVAPQLLNLVKGVIAVPFFVVGSFVAGLGVPVVDKGDVGWLVGSAVLGMMVADTGYFFALKKLGAARGVLFVPLVPLTTAVLASAVLGEAIGPQAIVGMFVTLAGLGIVLTQKDASSSSSSSSSSLLPGLLAGALYTLSQAAANVAAKHVLDHADAVHVATLRLSIGIVALFIASLLTGALPGLRVIATRAVLPAVVAAALIGTLGGIWLGTLGTKHLPVGVATTLAATTPIWALLLARLSGEAVKPRSFVGALVAVCGVVVLALATTK